MKKSELREIIRKELGILNEDQSSDFVKMKDELAKLLGKDNYKIINRNRYTLIISRSSKSQP